MNEKSISQHTVFNLNRPTGQVNNTLPFFGEPLNIQRYDKVAWPFVKNWYTRGMELFWRPVEVDCTKDKADYESLPEHEKHIFISNIKRQSLLDSIQGRAPFEAFLAWASSPEMEFAVIEWGRQESVHSLSYTHILQSTLNDPSPVFDTMLEIEEIVDCAKDISVYYDDIIRWSGMKMAGRVFTREDTLAAKKAFWRAMFAANALEGIRFYVSFACSFAFPQFYNGKMEGNAKVIRLIARDEQEHMMLTQSILTRLPLIDSDFALIREELRAEMTDLYCKVADQEKGWVDYLFKDGSMLGLNARGCYDYIDYLASIRLKRIGHQYPYDAPTKNPFGFTLEWLNNKETQYALQEAEAADYLGGITTGTVDADLVFNFPI